ncbi:MAG TPA: ribosome-associated translation inhibitor RaiA [Candidatus Pacearchaeota archaeon]|nr:ribosome-associated translation inhibitor RaiA [Candidatus Parcubacteria bacterium]HNZ83788.1 ribosome-associated translation inhibitor RaiA [Candidatus Pacearchaeota archaeon]HOU45948.1 ribosome-associated translation inhibitor RaiA [Candidatus Pacearchaeota archaeon]HPM08671.1 ribosome-associated translation inhibitor RaiA [Candidatus Pacearchaeota archaeon]HQI74653.1 ribosome-associated translation inhibitor RaiA [Candidatus Pacearchaeota archaeon]
MKIIIKATNFDLTPSIEGAVQEKLGALEKFIPKGTEPIEMRVEVGLPSFKHQSGEIFRTEANLRIHADILRTEAYGEDLFASINQVKDNMQRLIERYKGKHPDRTKKVSEIDNDDFKKPF